MSKWKYTLKINVEDDPEADWWTVGKFQFVANARWIADMLRDRGYITQIVEKK